MVGAVSFLLGSLFFLTLRIISLRAVRAEQLIIQEIEIQYRQHQKAESLDRMAGAIAHHFNDQLQMGNGKPGNGHGRSATRFGRFDLPSPGPTIRANTNYIHLMLTNLLANAWETLTALRNLSPDIPVILSSGYDESQVMAGEHIERPNAFLGKPYQLKGLGDTIRRVLANKTSAVQA